MCKWLLGVISVLACVILLAACGGDTDKSTLGADGAAALDSAQFEVTAEEWAALSRGGNEAIFTDLGEMQAGSPPAIAGGGSVFTELGSEGKAASSWDWNNACKKHG